LGFGIWDLGFGFDLDFGIGISGVNLIFKPIINLKGDARILLSHPLLPGGGGRRREIRGKKTP
jgi:hypothetical protein